MSEPLTDAQVENYRRLLIGILGPYALIMPREQIEAYRNKLQETIDKGFGKEYGQSATGNKNRISSNG